MAATGIGNRSGAQVYLDGGAPRIITGYARETISGGVYVYASGAAGGILSTVDSIATSDILFAKDASGGLFNGICLQTAGSNTPVSVLTRGTVILQANGAAVAGTQVKCDGNNAVQACGSTTASIGIGPCAIGRLTTEAASGGFCLVDIYT